MKNLKTKFIVAILFVALIGLLFCFLYGCKGEIRINNKPTYEIEDSIFVYYVSNHRWVATWDGKYFISYSGKIDTLLWINNLDTFPYPNIHKPYKKSK